MIQLSMSQLALNGDLNRILNWIGKEDPTD